MWNNVARALFVFFLISSPPANAQGSVSFDLRDQEGERVGDAVIILYPLEGQTVPKRPEIEPTMSQQNMAFEPFVLPVALGTEVGFPNRDDTRHHVYSFSSAKIFELRLFDGDEERFVLFDQPGDVVLGCNIHDSMLAYIYVVDTPYFYRSSVGGPTAIEISQPGRYLIKIWHPRMPSVVEREVEVPENLTVEVAQDLRLRRAGRRDGRY